ncbi:MAG: hypothetical protein J6A61_07545 [Clostridia bacterium]|nr:hypothetical protein [Clostridia bacterium]
MNQKNITLIYIGIALNLVLFGVAHYFQLPLLPYHTGTLYTSALLGTGAGILCASVTMLAIACLIHGQSFVWFLLSGVLIAILVGGQLKQKSTRLNSWCFVAGEVFVCDLFFYILFTILFHNSIPYDYVGQRIFMFFYEQEMEEVFAVCMAGTTVVLISSIQAVITAFLGILCTPKSWICPPEAEEKPLKQKRLKSKKNQN